MMFTEIEIFRFWPKNVDYSLGLVRRFIEFISALVTPHATKLKFGPACSKENIRHALHGASSTLRTCKSATLFFTKFRIEVVFELFLLLTGRCYEAEFCDILLLLRCAFAWYPFLLK